MEVFIHQAQGERFLDHFGQEICFPEYLSKIPQTILLAEAARRQFDNLGIETYLNRFNKKSGIGYELSFVCDINKSVTEAREIRSDVTSVRVERVTVADPDKLGCLLGYLPEEHRVFLATQVLVSRRVLARDANPEQALRFKVKAEERGLPERTRIDLIPDSTVWDGFM